MSFQQCVRQVYRRGLCVNASHPDSWFRDEPRGPGALELQRRYAEEACASCPVRAECLTMALTQEAEAGMSWGIWGGVCARDRQDTIEYAQQSPHAPNVETLVAELLTAMELSESA